MKLMKLGERLSAVAGLVRDGAILADVGTDHAYLPIALLSSGKITRAICSDINEGPLGKARDNAKASLMHEKIEFYLTDGARELCGLGVTDYAICGMGGELIASIIDSAPHLRDSSLNLVLQPMSRHEALREYLWERGFLIESECYPYEDGKRYVCMRVRFVGEASAYSPCEAYFGKHAFVGLSGNGAFEYVLARADALRAIIRGKRVGGADVSYELGMLDELEKKLNYKL